MTTGRINQVVRKPFNSPHLRFWKGFADAKGFSVGLCFVTLRMSFFCAAVEPAPLFFLFLQDLIGVPPLAEGGVNARPSFFFFFFCTVPVLLLFFRHPTGGVLRHCNLWVLSQAGNLVGETQQPQSSIRARTCHECGCNCLTPNHDSMSHRFFFPLRSFIFCNNPRVF